MSFKKQLLELLQSEGPITEGDTVPYVQHYPMAL
jgi:hypothetical protein